MPANTETIRGRDIRLLDGRLHPDHATSLRAEAVGLRLDAAGSPAGDRVGAGVQGPEDEVAAAVLVHVVGAGGRGFDLARTETAARAAS